MHMQSRGSGVISRCSVRDAGEGAEGADFVPESGCDPCHIKSVFSATILELVCCCTV